MAKDPYKYFRIEARELLNGLNQSVLALDKGGPTGDLVGHVLRLTHTLKGAARIVKQAEIAELAHSIESAFAPWRERRERLPKDLINQALGLLDQVAAKLPGIEPAREETVKETQSAAEEFGETVRVEVEEIDALLNNVAETSTQLAALRQESRKIDWARQLASMLVESLA